MRERNDLQLQNDLAKRTTGNTHPAVDERIGQINDELDNIANQHLDTTQSVPEGAFDTLRQTTQADVPEFRPQDEPRPADQAVEQQPGQQPAAPERTAGVERGGQQGNSEQTGRASVGQTAGTSNRQNVETYGEGEIPSGQGADTVQLLDNARRDIRSGAVDPYSVLSKTRARGIANPEEYAALAAEHERLVNDAVAKQKANDPTAPQAVQAAEDFANAIQPHKTAASDVFRLMQGDLNYDLGTPFGMNEYMKAELGRGMKPSETPKFTRMANDIGRAEGEVPKAVERSDARVRSNPRYAKVADIPIEDAAARVKEFLKDCVV
jgi:hypothetical protein